MSFAPSNAIVISDDDDDDDRARAGRRRERSGNDGTVSSSSSSSYGAHGNIASSTKRARAALTQDLAIAMDVCDRVNRVVAEKRWDDPDRTTPIVALQAERDSALTVMIDAPNEALRNRVRVIDQLLRTVTPAPLPRGGAHITTLRGLTRHVNALQEPREGGGHADVHRPHVIAMYAPKGGVGKTTVCVEIASELVRRGKRVVVVDADPQMDLTSALLPMHLHTVDMMCATEVPMNIADAYRFSLNGGERPFEVSTMACVDVTDETARALGGALLLVRGSDSVGDLDFDLNFAVGTFGTENRANWNSQTHMVCNLVRCTASVYRADFVFIDLNPGNTIMNAKFVVHADHLLVPANSSLHSARSVRAVARTLTNEKGWFSRALEMLSAAEELRLRMYWNSIRPTVRVLGVIQNEMAPGAQEEGEEAAFRDATVALRTSLAEAQRQVQNGERVFRGHEFVSESRPLLVATRIPFDRDRGQRALREHRSMGAISDVAQRAASLIVDELLVRIEESSRV